MNNLFYICLFNNMRLFLFEGSRTCIGKNVAEMELFLFTTTLIQRCRLQHATPYEPLDMEGVQSGITLLPKPYKVRIRDRSCSVGVERQISIY